MLLVLVFAGHPISDSLEEEAKKAFSELERLITGKESLVVENHCCTGSERPETIGVEPVQKYLRLFE